METRIETQFGPIRYERSTNFPLQEGAFLSQSIKEAFIYLNSSLSKLKKRRSRRKFSKFSFQWQRRTFGDIGKPDRKV